MNLPALIDSSISFEEGVLQLTFDRHDVRNALTGTGLIQDIVNTVEWANQCPDVNVLIMTRDGSAFSGDPNFPYI